MLNTLGAPPSSSSRNTLQPPWTKSKGLLFIRGVDEDGVAAAAMWGEAAGAHCRFLNELTIWTVRAKGMSAAAYERKTACKCTDACTFTHALADALKASTRSLRHVPKWQNMHTHMHTKIHTQTRHALRITRPSSYRWLNPSPAAPPGWTMTRQGSRAASQDT